MAFFNRNKKIKKKKGNAPEENQITSAEIARQRAEDIQSNYDSDDLPEESYGEEISEANNIPEANNTPEDLDPLLSGGLDDSMLSFDDDVERDIEEESENSPLEEEEESTHDFFAGVELPDENVGDLSETDKSFDGLYEVGEDLDGENLEEDSNEVTGEEDEGFSPEISPEESHGDDIPSASEIAEGEEQLNDEDLVQCLNDVIEDQVIDDDTEEKSNNGMASKTQIYMAMQVFDSESGEFDMQGVDNQLIFDTDDEDSFEFSCHNDEEKPKEQYNVEDYMFDTSEEE